MIVQVEKLRSKGTDNGLFPAGFKVEGNLVTKDGMDIDDVLRMDRSGIYLRIPEQLTGFNDRPYQFATDQITAIRYEGGRYRVETIASEWRVSILA